jgi:Flp pilus assembly protein TadG
MNSMRKLTLLQFLRQIRRSEVGSAMVETALTFPIFIAMLLGAFELGDLAFKANEITNAARAAAQYAAAQGGGYTDCDGTVPDVASPTYATAKLCSPTRGMYTVAKSDAPWVYKACTSLTVKAASSCTCSGSGLCAFSATAGYSCSSPSTGRPVIVVSAYTSAQCSPAASVPNLFPVGSLFTISGYSQQEVTQ